MGGARDGGIDAFGLKDIHSFCFPPRNALLVALELSNSFLDIARASFARLEGPPLGEAIAFSVIAQAVIGSSWPATDTLETARSH